jgi:septal ring factor EnvC (AmiA/AmiB activator)
VESLVGTLNAREELAQVTEREKNVTHGVDAARFAHLKGKLVFPVEGGKVLTSFGRTFDAQTGLYLFKKGVEISAGKNQDVRAVSSGQVAYVGELSSYGQVMIIDHGDHYYSLFSHLGDFGKKVHDRVAAGESIGKSDNSGNPLYFEIRSRNVAVNPLQWLTN